MFRKGNLNINIFYCHFLAHCVPSHLFQPCFVFLVLLESRRANAERFFKMEEQIKLWKQWVKVNSLSIGVSSVGGRPDMTVMRKTVMLSMVEIPRVIFSPDSAGIRNTNLNQTKNTIDRRIFAEYPANCERTSGKDVNNRFLESPSTSLLYWGT